MPDGSAPVCYAMAHDFEEAAAVIRQAGGGDDC